MFQRIDGDDHPLRDLFVVFPMAQQPPSEVFLCDQRQLQEAVDVATGDDPPRIVMVIPLIDMPHIAQLLQLGMTAWISKHPIGKQEVPA